MGVVDFAERRELRRDVEMFARLRCGIARSTVVLKDLTRLGARIEGVGPLERDEAVSLALPGMKPLLAFVAWANEHCAGLEFAEALPEAGFGQLIDTYGLNTGSAPLAA